MELTEENKKQFYIPEGFAHGFLVLSDIAEFCYKCTDFYHPGDEGGLAWNDPEIGIEWPTLTGEYKGTASGEGYALEDGTALNLSEKEIAMRSEEAASGRFCRFKIIKASDHTNPELFCYLKLLFI